MKRLLPLILCLLVLAPIYAIPAPEPSSTAPKLDLTQVLQLYTPDEIADAAARAGLTIYTEDDALAAIAEASRVAAETAVAEAVPQAVNIALADYAKRHGAEVGLWRGVAIAGWTVAIVAGIVALVK